MLLAAIDLALLLSAAPFLEVSDGFRLVEDKGKGLMWVYDGQSPVLAYNFGDQIAAGIAADRTRSSYIHPIYGLDGEVFTADFPKDHPHHRGLSWMWPRMKVGDREVELWHIRGIRSYFDKWIERSADRKGAVLTAANVWKLDDGRKVADETVRLRIHPASEIGRAIDVELRFTALSEPIMLQGQVGKGYGGLNLRFAPREDTVLTTDAGPHSNDSDKLHFKWADLSSRIAGRPRISGIAVLVHPEHPDFPPPWTLRYYGDLNAAWPGVEPVTLKPGKAVRLKYRLWIHRGDANDGRVDQAWNLYRSGGE